MENRPIRNQLESECPKTLSDAIAKFDYSQDQGDAFFSKLDSYGEKCQSLAIGLLAKGMKPETNFYNLNHFFQAIQSYGRFYSDVVKAEVKEAYLRILPKNHPDLTGAYFGGLLETKINIVEELRGNVKEDWSFKSYNQRDDITWSYALYRAQWGDESGLDQIAKCIAQIQPPVDEILIALQSLFFLRKSANEKIKGKVNKIIEPYLKDQRRMTPMCGDPLPGRESDACEKQGLTLGESLKISLQAEDMKF